MGGKTQALVLENHWLSHRGGADFFQILIDLISGNPDETNPGRRLPGSIAYNGTHGRAEPKGTVAIFEDAANRIYMR